MSKRTIDSFFKKKVNNVVEGNAQSSEPVVDKTDEQLDLDVEQPQNAQKSPRIEVDSSDMNSIIRDPGLRKPIENYPVNERDGIRKTYIKFGPYQPYQDNYPYSSSESHNRRFQYHWFKKFSWLEYSPTTDAVYCFPCFLFAKKPTGKYGSDTFTVKGFRNWKKVNDGKNCKFLNHMGKDSNSAHNFAINCFDNLTNHSCHIEKVIEKQTSEQILNNRLRLKASIDVVRWLTFQSCAYRGHDESIGSNNQGNFLELIKLLASYNDQVNAVVMENAPQNAKYTSPRIQKEILQIFAMNVQIKVREEIGTSKFCLLVDESRDIAKREQMAIVVRFVDTIGCVRERFFDLVHVKDTTSLTLKNKICSVLSNHNLSIDNIRGQGYDGASNMRGEWNGLQALFLRDCPYAYYVHCLAHRLQLALVTAAREVPEIHTFFQNLVFIVNIVTSSSKRHDQLRETQMAELAHLIESGELDTGVGANQISTLQRPGDTRWSSHYKSVCSLINLYGPTSLVLADIATGGSTFSQKGDAKNALNLLMSFHFVFILHLVKEIMGITEALCQALQQKSQDIVNAMQLVSSTKHMIQNLRNNGWEALTNGVQTFCERHDITVPDMSAPYVDILRSLRRQGKQKHPVTTEHHFRIEIFTAAVDRQLEELNSRFSERTTELLILSEALNPKDGYTSFKMDDICKLVEVYYPEDFSTQEKDDLRYELQHYEFNIPKHPVLGNINSIVDLCQGMTLTRKSERYPLVDRLLRLVLTLPVSTATTERAFSAMKIIKTALRSKMEDDFLTNYMIVYIEKEIAMKFSSDMIIDDFYKFKDRRVQLK